MAAINLLSDSQVKKAKEGYTSDGGNLYVRRRGSGINFVFRFKVRLTATWAGEAAKGKPVEIGLGSYPAKSLKAAREIAERLRAEVAADRNPALILKPAAEPMAKTFKDYAVEYIANRQGKRGRNGNEPNAKHLAQWPSTLQAYAYPHIGAKRPAAITVADIMAILTPIWATKTETATRVRQRVEAVIDYAYITEEIDRRNPARWKNHLDKIMPSPREVAGKVKHHAAPPWQEVPTIMAALREKDSTSALALRFSVLTAARSMEVRGAQWSEIDRDKALWHVPEARMKAREAHTVPLSAEALSILSTMAERARAKLTSAGQPDDAPIVGRVFPGPTGGLLSDVAINKTLHAVMPAITAHGLARSCFRDWGAEATSFPGEVLETALAHKDTNAVRAAYLRTNYLERRIELMSAWENFINEGQVQLQREVSR
ncbi:tyrosine-type recombinase/integrase [Sphingomonas sp. LR60]|uniref:tyrosine-type recombinase/integrase n=1 Tax=Sphingomonas sp. LR60 TaxID=3050233 RepID=UPI002FE0A591